MKTVIKSTGLALLASALLLPAAAHAQITMSVDTTAKTLTLSGSATGIPTPRTENEGNPVYQNGNIVWTTSVQGAGFEILDLPGSFDVSDGVLDSEFPTLTVLLGSQVILRVSVLGNGPDPATQPQTLTGQGTFSYAGLSLANQAAIESLIGGEIGLNSGTGFGAIEVTGVPLTPGTPPVIYAPETIRPRDVSARDPLTIMVAPPMDGGDYLPVSLIVEAWKLNGAGKPVDMTQSVKWDYEWAEELGMFLIFIQHSGGVGTVYFLIAESEYPTGEKSIAVSITEVVRK